MAIRKEHGAIDNSGMGGFLNPPTHPEHIKSVRTELHRRRENQGGMSLSCAVNSEYLDNDTRQQAKRILDEWQAPLIDSEEIQEWILQVLGYFRNMYNKTGGDNWACDNLTVDRDSDPITLIDQHAGINLIRQYYPDFTPVAKHFEEAYWGTKPQVA